MPDHTSPIRYFAGPNGSIGFGLVPDTIEGRVCLPHRLDMSQSMPVLFNQLFQDKMVFIAAHGTMACSGTAKYHSVSLDGIRREGEMIPAAPDIQTAKDRFLRACLDLMHGSSIILIRSVPQIERFPGVGRSSESFSVVGRFAWD